MRIVITGGCGFLGRRLALLLLEQGSKLGAIDELVLFDNAPPVLPLPDDKRITLVTGDIADREAVRRLIAPGTVSVFHLAAIVSGQAEADTISATASTSTAPAPCSMPAAQSNRARA